MQKWFFIAAFSLVAQCVYAQQHFLEKGEIAPCHYTGYPNIRMVPNTVVTVLLSEEITINSHVCGKVTSIFHVNGHPVVLLKTNDDLYVGFSNLKQAFVKKGDEIKIQTPIGIPLPGIESGKWELHLTYDKPEYGIPCEKAIEMIRLSQPNSIVLQEVAKK